MAIFQKIEDWLEEEKEEEEEELRVFSRAATARKSTQLQISRVDTQLLLPSSFGRDRESAFTISSVLDGRNHAPWRQLTCLTRQGSPSDQQLSSRWHTLPTSDTSYPARTPLPPQQ